MQQETIISVAIYDKTECVLYALPKPNRHHHILNKFFNNDVFGNTEQIQGFLTSKNRFVNRKEAMVIAKATNQIVNDIGYKGDELFSEHLW